MNPTFGLVFPVISLGIVLSDFTIAAEGPAAPEPKVVATIEKSAKPNGACIVRAEVRDPQSNDVLFEPKLQVAAGQEANVSSSDADRKVEVTVKAGPGCAGGTYLVNVWASGKLAYSKAGALKARAQ